MKTITLRRLAFINLLAASLLAASMVTFSACKKDKPEPHTDLTPEDYVYYSSNDTIYRVKSSGGTPEMLFNGTDDAAGSFKDKNIWDIAIEPTSGKIAFITNALDFSRGIFVSTVFVGNRDGSGTLTQIANGKVNGTFGNTAYSIGFTALAAANGKFYIECQDEFIGVMNADGTGVTKLFEGLIEDYNNWLYYDIAVDPATNTLYSLGDTAVWKISLTASNSQPVNIASNKTTDDTFDGEQLVFRKSTEELFFTDFTKAEVFRVKTDGSSYTRLHTLSNDAYAIAIDEESGDLYFADDYTMIYKAKANGTKAALISGRNVQAIAYY